ncbi:hypothetical protein AVEN_154225-1 [Araneus ventricosus]|uniref:Uncharacterized protein n=1 Tax=Araneus ventricosus TaxID=182803 RepID=A0A4Y2GV36_ARAVE|nr:hypothetical protein AVEN_154225-1 [Araneus ventricosus]
MDQWLKTGTLKRSASKTEIRTTDLAAMEITVDQQDDNHEKCKGRLIGLLSFLKYVRPRWPSGKALTSGPEGRNTIPLKIRRVWGLLHAKSYVVVKRPPVGVARKFGEGVPAQVSSSSSDRGSKLRGPSLNSPRVASKGDVKIT